VGEVVGISGEASRFHTDAEGERVGKDAEERGEKVGGRGMMNYQRIVERERMLRHVMAPRQQSILSRLIGGWHRLMIRIRRIYGI
jgi:hypothetical protein